LPRQSTEGILNAVFILELLFAVADPKHQVKSHNNLTQFKNYTLGSGLGEGIGVVARGQGTEPRFGQMVFFKF